jgi:hypothetical protein
VRGQVWRETRAADCGRISKVVLVLGTTVFLQHCRQDGSLLDGMLIKTSERVMAAEDEWELLQF